LAGFLQQFAAVVDQSRPEFHLARVLAQLSGGRTPNRVLCTGHSLGGALATLGAAFTTLACLLDFLHSAKVKAGKLIRTDKCCAGHTIGGWQDCL
jgi:hypothetical protein